MTGLQDWQDGLDGTDDDGLEESTQRRKGAKDAKKEKERGTEKNFWMDGLRTEKDEGGRMKDGVGLTG